MATVQELTVQLPRDEGSEPREGKQTLLPQFNLEEMVSEPTWRDMLFELVETRKLDPWNIDIAEITEYYLASVRKMKVLDLHVPANIILAASILLRFKSDALRLEEEPLPQETFIEEMPIGEIPPLELHGRIPPQRRVTLEDLVGALDEAIKTEKQRQVQKVRRIEELPDLDFALPKFDIEERMESIFQRAFSRRDPENLVLFSALLDTKFQEAEEIISTLMPLLHLAQHERLYVYQEKIFGEIFIQFPEVQPGAEAGAEGEKVSASAREVSGARR